MKTRFLWLVVLVVGGCVLAGCGKDYNDGPTPPPRDRDSAPRTEGK